MLRRNEQLLSKNPFKNKAIKFKLKLTTDQVGISKEIEDDINSRNALQCDKGVSPRLNYPFSSRDQLSDERGTKMSHMSLITLNKSKVMNRPPDSPTKLRLTSHNFRKQPERFFAVNSHQFNIENKVMNSRNYQSISSFEAKWLQELKRVSQIYRKSDCRQMVYDNKTLTCLWKLTPRYDKYTEIKRIENRFSGTRFRSRLFPLGYKSKENLNRFAMRFYYNKCLLNEKLRLEEIANKARNDDNNS